MLKHAFVIAGAALLVGAPAAAHDHGKDKNKTSAQCAQIPVGAADALFSQWNAAWATKNPDTVTNLFARDAVLLPTVSKIARTDRAGIRDYFVGFLKNSPVGKINSSTVIEGCNMLVRMGSWSVDLTNPETKATNMVTGRYTFIYRYEDGAWKVAHLHSSLNPES